MSNLILGSEYSVVNMTKVWLSSYGLYVILGLMVSHILKRLNVSSKYGGKSI